MRIDIYDARKLLDTDMHPPEGKREFVVETDDMLIHVEKVFIDDEEVNLDEEDYLILDVVSVRFVDGYRDGQRDITVYKEGRIYTMTFSVKEAIRDGLEEAQYIVTWVVRPPE
jgi:hypothetical protein